jgi:threonine/homoserine/homoserine lactone efflux protein
MIIALLAGLVVGIVLAIPPGPVAVTTVKLTLDNGRRKSLIAATGTAMLDVFFCLIAVFTASLMLDLLMNFTENNQVLYLVFQITVVLLIFAFGILQIRKKKQIINPSEIPTSKRFKFLEELPKKGPFFLGIAVALTNIANPGFFPSLTYVAMNAEAFGFVDSGIFSKLLFSLGFGFGNYLWLYLLTKVISHYKSKMSELTLARIHEFAGYTLIGFGTILGWRVLAFTKWPEVVRLVFAF